MINYKNKEIDLLFIVQREGIRKIEKSILDGFKISNGGDKLCQISEQFYGFLLVTRDRRDFQSLLKTLKFEYP
jgi:hypothetical protein